MSDRSQLADYARHELRGEAVYRGYRPRAAILEEVSKLLERAHVVIVSGAWCADCRREVPKVARILELLPETWSVELRGDEDITRLRYEVWAVPTVIILNRPDGTELGRIVESPSGSDGIEGDLLEIARRAGAPEQSATSARAS